MWDEGRCGFGSDCVCFHVGPCVLLHAGVGPSAALGHSQEGKSQTFEPKMKAERRKGRRESEVDGAG